MSFTALEFIFFFLPLSYLFFRFFNAGPTGIVLISLVYLLSFGVKGFVSLSLFCLVNYIVLKRYCVKRSGVTFWLALIFNLFYLCAFKYFSETYPLLHDFYPTGISYFTFKAISILIDVRHLKVEASHLEFLIYVLYITYFPSLVAGPITRFKEIRKQFIAQPSFLFSVEGLKDGFFIFLKGMVYKILIADQAFEYFSICRVLLGQLPALNCLTAIFAYSIFIYYDFLGYNYMAIGVSRIFGVELPANFNSPYLKKNIIEFWNSWHITLSFWLRDYIFNPAGQFLLRKKFFRERSILTSAICYLVTFTLCGAWHGVSTNYILWGVYHGSLIVCYKIICSVEKKAGIAGNPYYISFFKNSGFIFTYLFVSAGWVFFMFDSAQVSFNFIAKLFSARFSFMPGGVSSLIRAVLVAGFFFYDERRKSKTNFEEIGVQFIMAVIALKCVLSLSSARAFLYGGF